MRINLPRKNNIKQIRNAKSLVIFGLLLLFCGLPAVTEAGGASLYFSPGEGTFFIGKTFDVSVFVNTGGEDVNTVRADLKFDPKKLQVASPTAGKSFISVWIAQPSYSNIEGTINFRGGIPSPGINTEAGLVSTITFRPIASGTTAINILDSSLVLLNDGQGTNILTSRGRGVYTIVVPPPEGPSVFSPTHPDQNKWYKNNNPTFAWEREEGVTDFSYSFDEDPYGVPDNVSEGDYTSISYENVKDGIWYFHVKAKKGESWGGTSQFSVQIDTTPPAVFYPEVEPAEETSERQPLVSFITTDAFSGIDHYEIKYIEITKGKEEVDTGFFVEATTPYRLPQLEIGRYLAIVKAYDKAGNVREGTVKITILPEGLYFDEEGIHYNRFFISWRIFLILSLLFLIITILLILYFLRRHRKSVRERRENLEMIKKDLEEKKTNLMPPTISQQ